MLVQPTLFEADTGLVPLEPHRHWLDAASWVDVHAAWFGPAAGLLAGLINQLEWFVGRRILFDDEVAEPRLSGSMHHPDEHPLVREMADALSDHYRRKFDSVFVNRYRSGDDAVAWHRDRIHRRQSQPLVAIVTLGAARPFLMRPTGGGPSTRFRPGAGDLLVMGGRSQHDWEHCVPRTRRVHMERISVTLRPSEDQPAR